LGTNISTVTGGSESGCGVLVDVDIAISR